MLSVIDLIEAGTLTHALAAWLLARILEGNFWMVGARPGGAGKTTVMTALLAMLPPGEQLFLTNRGTGWREASPGDCVVCCEISPGGHDAYIWGEDVAHLAALAASGCRVVTNLHADTIEEARAQIVGTCGASLAHFAAMGLFLPIRTPVRAVPHVMASGAAGWSCVSSWPDANGTAIGAFLSHCLDAGLRTVEDVRGEWLKHLENTTGDAE